MKVRLPTSAAAAPKPVSPLMPKSKLGTEYNGMYGDHAPERKRYDSDESYDGDLYLHHYYNTILHKNRLKGGDGWSRGHMEEQKDAKRSIRFHESEMKKLEQKYRKYAVQASMKITMSASRKIVASADLTWPTVYKRFKAAALKHIRVVGAEPTDDVGFSDTMQGTDKFWPFDSDGQLQDAIKDYAKNLAEHPDEVGDDNPQFQFIADEVYNCLEEMMGKVQDHYGSRWNHAPGYVPPKKIEWIDDNGKPSNDEALSVPVAFKLLGLTPPKKAAVKKKPSKRYKIKRKGAVRMKDVLADYKKADYAWQAPVLKVLEQVEEDMDDRVFYQLMDELWKLFHQGTNSIIPSLLRRMAEAYGKAGGNAAMLKKLIQAVDHDATEKSMNELGIEFGKLLPKDPLLKEFRSAANGNILYQAL